MIPLIQLTLARRRLPACAFFSGPTAAWLHGIDFPPCDPIEITLPRLATTSRLTGISIKRSDLGDDEVTEVHDLPVTSRVRTVADLGRRLSLVDAVVAIDMALHVRLVTVEQLAAWAASHAGYHGLRRLRAALELANSGSESPMETRLRMLLISGGLPTPQVQASLYDDYGAFIARPDLYYPSSFLAIEYDGAIHRASLVADNRRQNRMMQAGYQLLRFTASDVFGNQALVLSQVGRALTATRPGAVRPA